MTIAGKLFRFFLYSNLFIACCANLMVYQTSLLLLQKTPDIHFIWFVFFATICSYSFHWYLTPAGNVSTSDRMLWLTKNRNVHSILFFFGFTGAVVSGLFLLAYWKWLLLSIFITFLYSAPKMPYPWFRLLRKVALGKTIFLALVWTYVTTILPLIIGNRGWSFTFSLFAASRFFLIYAICILFDYRDREYDRAIGIRSLITWLSERGITGLFIASLLAFVFFTVAMVPYGRLSYSNLFILLIPGVILAPLYRYAQKKISDIFYYFILDGLMALPALLTLIFGH